MPITILLAGVLAAVPMAQKSSDAFAYPVEEELHPLNDAWLGMPIFDVFGRKLGKVAKAPVDQNNAIPFLFIEPLEPNQVPSDSQYLKVRTSAVIWTAQRIIFLQSR